MSLPYRVRLILVSIVISVTLAGCQPDASGDKAATAAAAAPAPLVVDDIQVGHAEEGAAAAMRPHTPKDPISVAVKTSGLSQGASLEVKIIDLSNGQSVASETRQLKVSAPTITRLTFKQEKGWTPGRHLVEVTLDGKLVGQRDIDVVDMPVEPEAKK